MRFHSITNVHAALVSVQLCFLAFNAMCINYFSIRVTGWNDGKKQRRDSALQLRTR